jgi:hypothetical protein
LFAVSALWVTAFGKLERCRIDSPPADEENGGTARQDLRGRR